MQLNTRIKLSNLYTIYPWYCKFIWRWTAKQSQLQNYWHLRDFARKDSSPSLFFYTKMNHTLHAGEFYGIYHNLFNPCVRYLNSNLQNVSSLDKLTCFYIVSKSQIWSYITWNVTNEYQLNLLTTFSTNYFRRNKYNTIVLNFWRWFASKLTLLIHTIYFISLVNRLSAREQGMFPNREYFNLFTKWITRTNNEFYGQKIDH